MMGSVEWNRILFVQERDGMDASREFVKRTYAKYRECLRLDGKRGRKFHHASLPQYRRGFVESCLTFREYLRKTPVGRSHLGRLSHGEHPGAHLTELVDTSN